VFTYIPVVAEDVESSNLSRGPLQIRQDFKGFSSVGNLGKCLEGGSEDESTDESRKLHDE